MTVAIEVHGLGKRYRLGARQASYRTLRDSIVAGIKSPFARMRRTAEERAAAAVEQTFWSLRDISFTVDEGEAVGIIGRNGAGKSTLLKVLSRITEPTTGWARIHGRLSTLLEVGTGFHPELTGRDNVFLNGTILGMRTGEVRRKFDEIVAFAEVDKFIDTPVKHYSSGMYLRLAFAVAAFLEPDILVVDEVLAVGDAEFQKKCLGKMQDVAGQGRTVLFVSHNILAIKALCKTSVYLREGQIQARGPVTDVCNAYLHDSFRNDTFTDGGITARIDLLQSDGTPVNSWGVGEDLIVRIELTGNGLKNVPRPAIDLAMYSAEGVRIFAMLSDSDAATKIDTPFQSATFDFRLHNPGLTISEVYFDIGVRDWQTTNYCALFRQAKILSVLHGGLPNVLRSNTIVWLPSSVALHEVR